MSQTSGSLDDALKQVGIRQFAYGKIIQGGLDVSGYARVAQSSHLPDEATIQQIRDRASVGQVHDLTVYGGSTVAFLNGPFAVAARFQRSPKKDSRGYFLQEHYLLLPRAQFATLGNDYSYLIHLLPDEIPWREQAESLRVLDLPPRNPAREQQQFQEMWGQRREQLLYLLQLALDGQRFALSVSPQELPLLWRVFNALNFLLPLACRAELSWGYNILNLSRNQSRLKAVTGNPTGSEGYLFLNLATVPDSRPLVSQDSNTRSYLTNLIEYEQRFGWEAMLKLLEATPCPSPGQWVDMPYNLAIALWQTGGAAIVGHQLAGEKRPYPASLLSNIQSLLDQPQALDGQQQVGFVTAVLSGYLDNVLPVADSAYLPPKIMATPPALGVWSQLTELFRQSTTNGRGDTVAEILKVWRQNETFWRQAEMQQLLFTWHQGTLMAIGQTAETTLHHLQQQANQGLTPLNTTHQAQLLMQAITSGQNYWPESLLTAWIAMAANPQQALAVADQVVPLQAILRQNSDYTYILWGLQGSSNDEINRMLARVTPQTLDRGAEFLLLLAQKGMQWQLPGFTAGELLLMLDMRVDKLPTKELETLVNQILGQPALLTPKTHQALSLLLLSLGKMEQFSQLAHRNRNWIDFIIAWQERHPALSPVYHQVMTEARKWFDPRPSGISQELWLTRLRQVFERRTNLMRNTPQAVNIFTELLLKDAFDGYSEENLRSSVSRKVWKDENKTRVDSTVGKIVYVRQTLFPPNQRMLPEVFNIYLDKLGNAFATWNTPRLANHLIQLLQKKGLTQEATYIHSVHVQKRGGEIIRELRQLLTEIEQDEKQEELADVLQGIGNISAQDLRAVLGNPQQRDAFRTQVAHLEQTTAWLAQELGRLRSKL